MTDKYASEDASPQTGRPRPSGKAGATARGEAAGQVVHFASGRRGSFTQAAEGGLAIDYSKLPVDADDNPFAELANLQELELEFDARERLLWVYMKPRGRPCFTPQLLYDSRRIQQCIERVFTFRNEGAAHAETVRPATAPLAYLVLGSRLEVFNLGGDLRLLTQLVRAQSRDKLMEYARACIDVCYANAIHGNLPFVTIALVQGDALGGGFESALSANVLIAERGTQFGLPEVVFNLFPGMGAYSFLSRRIGGAQAEKMIFSGALYSAEQLYDMGLVDVLAEPGRGEEAVYEYIDRNRRHHNAHCGIYRTRQAVDPVSREEMMAVGEIWVDTALALSEQDLRRMERLINAQERRMGGDDNAG